MHGRDRRDLRIRIGEGAWAGGGGLRTVHASRAGGSHGRGVRCQPKSNTVTGVIGPVRGKTRFCIFGVFKVAFPEISKLVWSLSIPLLFSFIWVSIGGVKSQN